MTKIYYTDALERYYHEAKIMGFDNTAEALARMIANEKHVGRVSETKEMLARYRQKFAKPAPTG